MDASIYGFLGLAAVATVGSVQWVKGFFPWAPSWVWRILMALMCIAWGLAIQPTWLYRGLYGLLLIALCEAGYKVIVQKLGEVAASLLDKLG